MKHLLIICTFLLFLNNSFGQKDSLKLNNIHIELLGSAGNGSINYGRLVQLDKKTFLDLSFGGMYSPRSSNLILLPQINLLFGNKHFFETGYALRNSFEDGNIERNSSIRLGYRYQNLRTGGFMFRAGFTPIFNIDFLGSKITLPWIGLSVGYGF